ncbi:MAG: GAF domain-containing protein [Chloroflexota bacterium]|nr:GAF domain-containing protein [Chloroflexota bacterium]
MTEDETGEDGPDSRNRLVADALAEVESAARRAVGVRLFTVLAWDDERGALHRVYTNDPVAYPLSGEKVMPRNAPWIADVVVGQRTYLGRDPAGVAEVFSDHELISSLGCGAVINVPVVDGGRTLGVLNLLDAEGTYDEAAVAAALPLADRCVQALRVWHDASPGPPQRRR